MLCLVSFYSFAPDGRAATNTWAPNGLGPSDGSGSWRAGGNWWNGSAIVNGTWTGTTPDDAIFGAGTNGSYAVTVGTVTANSVTFTDTGYVLSSGTLALPINGSITVASNQTATINATVHGTNIGQNWTVNSNATLNVGGDIQSMQVKWQGAGTVNLNGTNTPSIFWVNTTVNQTAGTLSPTAYSFIGYGANGTYNLNGAAASLNMNSGNFTIGRAGDTGTMNIQSGAANIGATSVQNLNLVFDSNNNGAATVNVFAGGTLNVGSAGIASLIEFMPNGSSSQEKATLNICGGVVNAQGIEFGSTNTYSGGTAQISLTNGSLYLGSQGIFEGANFPGTNIITLSGGLVGAWAGWSSAMNMVLTNIGGNITFQAADASNNPHDISLSGILSGAGGLTKAGAGTLTLGGANTYTGATSVSNGTLAVTTAGSGGGSYNISGASTLNVQTTGAGNSLAMPSLTLGAGAVLQLNAGSFGNPSAPLINISGSLIPSMPVTINLAGTLTNGQFPIISYGSLGGAGFNAFVFGSVTLAGGAVGSASLVNNTNNHSIDINLAVYQPSLAPSVVIPTLNTNEIVVALATPQEFGARGDGVTDDSAAFQNAMNAVYNSGGPGGGVIFVPAANYAFCTNLTVPQGVTLHGDWTDWTKGSNGLVGTTFKIYFGAGQSNAPAFIFMNTFSSIKDINFWYPNQDPNNITAYPFTIQINEASVLKNVVLVNSYQGIEGIAANHSSLHILSTVIGSPLYMGISLDFLTDISHTEDIRFSPDIWAASNLTNSPAPGGSYAAWMRANGEGMKLLRVDGELSVDTCINGYNVGIEANSSTNGAPGATFYGGSVSNCGTALLAQEMPGQSGLQFTRFTLDGDIAVNRTHTTNDATLAFDHCQIIGRQGTAVYSTGADWHSWMAFQDCAISNTMQLAGPGVFNVVDSSLSGNPQCLMSASATRAAFTGCTFGPATNIINQGNAGNLLMDARQSLSNILPIVNWTSVLADYASRKPAKTNLYVVTDAAWGAHGNGTNDDTAAIQSALAAAGNNGGGIVYLPAGKYHLTNTLDVPGGVELRGVREMRGGDGTWTDGHAKASVLQPYGGQGTANGPVAVALEANSGLVGVNFSYESQNSNCIPFPATIQGRGANIYAIGVVCPNTFYYVDLDTCTCTNHLIYMVDGWTLNRGFVVGHGSSGSIVDCQGNQSYWLFNNDSKYVLGSSGETAAIGFAQTNLQMYVLGDCTELLVEDFNITANTFVRCVSENDLGPNLTGIGAYCDGTVQGYVLDAAAPCNIKVVNSTMAIFASDSTLTNAAVGVMATTNFRGTARFFNSALFAQPYWDFVVGGGDVGFDEVHMLNHAFNGSSVSGGILHLINNGAYITYNGASNFPPYNVTFATNAGIPGKVSEIIGGYAYNGYTYANASTNNPVNVWLDYALNAYSVLTRTNQFYESQSDWPPLSVQCNPTTQDLTLLWPGNVTGFTVYYTPSLSPPIAWAPVTNTPVISNGQWSIILPKGANNCGFYRLQY